MKRLFGFAVCAIAWIVRTAIVFGSTATPITQCETISQPGTYSLQQDIQVPITVETFEFVFQCLPAECLVVTAPGVSLDLNGYQISPIYGPPFLCPTGIHVEAGANNVEVKNGQLAGFQNSMLVEANNVRIDSVTTSTDGNIDGGNVVLNNVQNSKFTNLSINGGGAPGALIINDSTHNLFGKLNVNSSVGVGSLNVVDINGGADNVFYKSSVQSVAHGGSVLFITNNSTGNSVIDTTATQVNGLQGNGLVIAVGSTNNLILGSASTCLFNPMYCPATNMLDLNPDCDSNVWFDNTFFTANPAGCIF